MSCFFGHKWSKWEQYKETHVWLMKTGEKSEPYLIKKQKRTCLKCNKVEVERIDE
jgi:hypothetical protein